MGQSRSTLSLRRGHLIAAGQPRLVKKGALKSVPKRCTLAGPDGSTVDLLQAGPEQKKRWGPTDGGRISVVKQSQIGAYLATQNVTLDPVAGMTVTANYTLGFDHVNSGNHSVNWFYGCMSMFALPFKRWVAQLTNGTEVSGVFSSADAMTLQQDIQWMAVYDDDSRRGAVYQYPVGHAPQERLKTPSNPPPSSDSPRFASTYSSLCLVFGDAGSNLGVNLPSCVKSFKTESVFNTAHSASTLPQASPRTRSGIASTTTSCTCSSECR